jgi:putative endonuclease
MKSDNHYYVYIMANRRRGTLYVGVTNNIIRRSYEHKNHLVKGFTSNYDINLLVWFDETNEVEQALAFEKKIKNRGRAFKIALIEKDNPEWRDLSEDF